jgi:hypothetical protein
VSDTAEVSPVIVSSLLKPGEGVMRDADVRPEVRVKTEAVVLLAACESSEVIVVVVSCIVVGIEVRD